MREAGWYWVVWDFSEQISYWSEASCGWYLVGDQRKYADSDMDEIDERRLVNDGEQ